VLHRSAHQTHGHHITTGFAAACRNSRLSRITCSQRTSAPGAATACIAAGSACGNCCVHSHTVTTPCAAACVEHANNRYSQGPHQQAWAQPCAHIDQCPWELLPDDAHRMTTHSAAQTTRIPTPRLPNPANTDPDPPAPLCAATGCIAPGSACGSRCARCR
jgi:hypothetical protein